MIYAAGQDARDDGGLWSQQDADLGQYERMKGVDEKEYMDKWDTILRLRPSARK